MDEAVTTRFAENFAGDCPTVMLGDVLRISTKTLKPQEHEGEVWEYYNPGF